MLLSFFSIIFHSSSAHRDICCFPCPKMSIGPCKGYRFVMETFSKFSKLSVRHLVEANVQLSFVSNPYQCRLSWCSSTLAGYHQSDAVVKGRFFQAWRAEVLGKRWNLSTLFISMQVETFGPSFSNICNSNLKLHNLWKTLRRSAKRWELELRSFVRSRKHRCECCSPSWCFRDSIRLPQLGWSFSLTFLGSSWRSVPDLVAHQRMTLGKKILVHAFGVENLSQ